MPFPRSGFSYDMRYLTAKEISNSLRISADLSLNDRALYVLKLEYVELFFITVNNTRAFRYSKIEYLNKGKKVKPSFF